MSGARLDLDELAALESQRDFLLRSLDDLDREHEVGDLDDVDYETLRTDYTARAAIVLRSIEESHDLVAATAPSHLGVRRFMVVVAVLVVAVVAGGVVASFSGQGGPGKAAGGQDLTPSKATSVCIDFMTKAFAPAAQGQANASMASDSLIAIKCFTARLDAHPDDAVAATYRGWTLALLAKQFSGSIAPSDIEGFVRRARADFATATKLAPRYPDALAFSAINDVWSGDVAGATRLLARIDALDLPANSPILAQVNQMLRPLLRAAQTAATSTTVAMLPTTIAPSAS